jgi:ADP-ribosylation factor-like protein 2-binding protein
MDESFEKMQRIFSNDNCMQFEATEENKLVYMTIFKQYVDTTEQYITDKLNEAIQGFSMERFMGQLKTRKDEIDEPLMDLLLSLSEFESFKEMMLFARAHYVATTPKPRSSKAQALGLKDSIT